MRKDFERCHIFAAGMGARKKLGIGRGCECEENIMILTPYEHDVLDGRIYNHLIEAYKVKSRDTLNIEPKNYRHKIVFGLAFGKSKSIRRAIKHQEMRNRKETLCSRKK